jgi:hypothetical protein
LPCNWSQCLRNLDKGPSCSWWYSCWIYNYLCNQYLSPLTLGVRIPLRRSVLHTTICDNVYQWLATDRWFSPVSPTNKTDLHDIAEILLKVALNTITLTLTNLHINSCCQLYFTSSKQYDISQAASGTHLPVCRIKS